MGYTQTCQSVTPRQKYHQKGNLFFSPKNICFQSPLQTQDSFRGSGLVWKFHFTASVPDSRDTALTSINSTTNWQQPFSGNSFRTDSEIWWLRNSPSSNTLSFSPPADTPSRFPRHATVHTCTHILTKRGLHSWACTQAYKLAHAGTHAPSPHSSSYTPLRHLYLLIHATLHNHIHRHIYIHRYTHGVSHLCMYTNSSVLSQWLKGSTHACKPRTH